MIPTEVNVEKEDYISKKLYGRKKQPPKWKYVLGDKVRISKAKQTFKKGYLSSCSEIFIVVTRVPSDPVTYELKDLNAVKIQGKFHEQELQQIVKEDDVYKVEKVLKVVSVVGSENTLSNGKVTTTHLTRGQQIYSTLSDLQAQSYKVCA